MPDELRHSSAARDNFYLRCVVRALDGNRLVAVALVTLILSATALSSVQLFDFFSPAEIALLWLAALLSLSILGAALTIAYTLLDEAMWRAPTHLRLLTSCAMLFGLSIALTALLY